MSGYQVDPGKQCRARSRRSGEQCKRTRTPGSTVCYYHGSAAGQVRRKAAERLERDRAVAAVATFGLPVEVDPHDALLGEVHRTAGHVTWLGVLVAGLEADGLKQRSPGAAGVLWERPAVWVELYQQERAHLVRVAKAAVDAGVEERQVRVAEQAGAVLAEVLRAVLDDPQLGLTAEQRGVGGQVARRHLLAVGAGGG